MLQAQIKIFKHLFLPTSHPSNVADILIALQSTEGVN